MASQPFRFFDLPPELRNRIYSYVVLKPYHPNSPNEKFRPFTLRVNRQMRSETLLMFHNLENFCFYDDIRATRFVHGADRDTVKVITSLHLDRIPPLHSTASERGHDLSFLLHLERLRRLIIDRLVVRTPRNVEAEAVLSFLETLPQTDERLHNIARLGTLEILRITARSASLFRPQSIKRKLKRVMKKFQEEVLMKNEQRSTEG